MKQIVVEVPDSIQVLFVNAVFKKHNEYGFIENCAVAKLRTAADLEKEPVIQIKEHYDGKS